MSLNYDSTNPLKGQVQGANTREEVARLIEQFNNAPGEKHAYACTSCGTLSLMLGKAPVLKLCPLCTLRLN